MHCYSEEHIVFGDYAFEEWDPALVEELLALVVPTNMRVDILTKPFDRNGSGEGWFELVCFPGWDVLSCAEYWRADL